jgi:hypothetical protein
MQQDGEGGANTGLVALTLVDPPTVISLQPREPYALDWIVVIERRDEAVAMSGPVTLEYSHTLTTLSVLCAFLQTKSEGYLHHDVP